MMEYQTLHATHTSKNSNTLKYAEEEFGSLKRHLERRERLRLGLPPAESVCAEEVQAASPSGAQPSSTPEKLTTRLSSSVDEIFRTTSPPTSVDLPPLFPAGAAVTSVVRTAHEKHNRVVAEHAAQFSNGKTKVAGWIHTQAASSAELETFIAAAKVAQHGEPAGIDSGVQSNYMPIKDTLRGISALGADIDEGDASYNDFAFLQDGGSLSVRESILMKRLKEMTEKYLKCAKELVSATEALRAQRLDSDAALHDAMEAHRDALDAAQILWTEERQSIESDLQHWKGCGEELQHQLVVAKETLGKERLAFAAQLESLENKMKEESTGWMQTVAQLDREKHLLSRQARDAEERVTVLESRLQTAEATLLSTESRLADATLQVTALTSETQTLQDNLMTASSERDKLQAARPRMETAAVQVESDSILEQMKSLMEDMRRDNSKLRQETDGLRKRAQSTAVEIANAELLRKQLNSVQQTATEQLALLKNTQRRQQRDHERRMQLVCENYVLRSQLCVLQRPNGFGERMEELVRENQWLFQKLERATPMRVVTLRSEETEAHCVARRADDECIVTEGRDRDRVLLVSAAGTQTPPFAVQHSCERPMAWQSKGTQVDDQMLRCLDPASAGSEALRSYTEHSLTHKEMTERLSASKALSLAANRFKRPASACARVEPHNYVTDASVEARCTSAEDGGSKRQVRSRPASAASDAAAARAHAREASGSEPTATMSDVSTASFCVFGHHDAPQKNALSGNPSQYYALRRQSGLTGAAGKQREADLQTQLQLQRVVTVEAAGAWAPTNYAPAFTFPVRTTAQSSAAHQHPLEAFMPVTRPPGGAWKHM